MMSTKLDRSGWKKGPWDGEPDEKTWIDEATGFICYACRNDFMGHWCGYVGLPPNHPWNEKDYNDLPVLLVHGGVTFAGKGNALGLSGSSSALWFIGFDCAHAGDLPPTPLSRWGPFNSWEHFLSYSVYRTLEYVESECCSLALQALGDWYTMIQIIDPDGKVIRLEEE